MISGAKALACKVQTTQTKVCATNCRDVIGALSGCDSGGIEESLREVLAGKAKPKRDSWASRQPGNGTAKAGALIQLAR